MAGRIAGITIEIGGDTSNLQKSLKGVDGELRKTQSTLKDVNRLLKLDPGNTELLTQKQKNLEKAISTTKTRLDELKNAQAGVAQGSDEWDALQREIIATEQDLKSLEKEYSNFGSVGAQQIAAAGQKMQEFGGKVSAVGQAFAPVSAAAAGLVASLGALGYKAITGADDLNTLAKQTGLTTDEIQKMQYASDLVDVSFDDISGALKKLKSKMDPANKTFQKLGISVTNADGSLRDATDVFYESLDALSQIQNETERDQAAMELFGKSADSLAGIIDDGGAALKAYGKEAEDMGLILSGETIDNLNTLNDVVDKTKATFTGAFAKAGATLAETFAPALEKAAAFAQTLADKIANVSPETLKLITGIAGVVAVVSPLLVGIGKVTIGLGKVAEAAPKVVSGFKTVKAALAALSPTTVIIAAVAAAAIALGVVIYKNWDKIKAATQTLVKNVSAAWNSLKTSVSTAANNIKTAVTTAWDNLKNGVTTAISNLKSGVQSAWNAIKSSTISIVSGLVSTVSSKFRSVASSVTGIFNSIKSTISSRLEEAKQTASDIIETIKGFFTGAIKINFKLPKITMGRKDFETFAGTISIPWPEIKWERQGYTNPVMFTKPTVMATPNGYYGFGDGHGAEIVLGLNKLRELVGTSGNNVTINVYPPQGANVEQIAAAVEQKLVAAQQRRIRVYA